MPGQNRRFQTGVPKAKPVAHDGAGAAARSYVNGAPGKATYPWQAAEVSKFHNKDFNHRISDELIVKFKWLCNAKGVLIREGLIEALERYIDQEASLLGYEDLP